MSGHIITPNLQPDFSPGSSPEPRDPLLFNSVNLLPNSTHLHAYKGRPDLLSLLCPFSLSLSRPPGCSQRSSPLRRHRRRPLVILVSSDCPGPTCVHHFLSLTPAHLSDMILCLLALQNDGIVLYWISPSTSRAPVSNLLVSRSPRTQRSRHRNFLEVLHPLVRTSGPRNLSRHRYHPCPGQHHHTD
jgi:hypothetical protein